MTDSDVELDGVDLGRDSSELADEELGLDCGELWGGSGGVVSSNLGLLGGAAESIIFSMVRRSSGTSIDSTSETKNWLSSFFFTTK